MSVYRVRLRSPLRWLSALMSALAILALAGVSGAPWLVVAAPLVAGLFLLAPPLGVYRHDETPLPRARLALAAEPVEAARGAAYRLTLVNAGDVNAEDYRIRLIVPEALTPRDGPLKPLGQLLAGELGTHWFTETVQAGTAITFRAGDRADPAPVVCRAHESVALAELRVLNRGLLPRTPLAYQINGGNVGTVLAELRLG